MAQSAIPRDTFVGDATYILKTNDNRLPNSIPMDGLPAGVAENADILMVQKGGLGGLLAGVPVSSLPSGGGGGGLTWNVISTDTPMLTNNAYIIIGQFAVTLPTVSAVGDILRVVGDDSIFTVKQGAGQTIKFNTDITTTGAPGSIASTQAGQAIELVCLVENLSWRELTASGNLFTIV